MRNFTYLPHYERLHLAKVFLDTHYQTPITIERLSQEATLSPYHFIRLFRRQYKQTPHQYLIQRRIDRAKELLQSSDLPITEICVEVGFESLGSFSTLFRKATGLSPSVYRQKLAALPHRGFIPLCVCLLHDIDTHDFEESRNFREAKIAQMFYSQDT